MNLKNCPGIDFSAAQFSGSESSLRNGSSEELHRNPGCACAYFPRYNRDGTRRPSKNQATASVFRSLEQPSCHPWLYSVPQCLDHEKIVSPVPFVSTVSLPSAKS